jgi:exosortase
MTQPRLIVATKWLPVAAAVALWLVLFARLANEWSVNPQYGYGWAVPFLGAFVFWERWRMRPAPDASERAGGTLIAGALLLAAVWLPTRVILEAFPDWRPVLWAMAIVAVALSLLILSATGERAWFRHFLFPILFVLVAVPWPTPVENVAIQNLMTVNAGIATDTLTLFGHPAVQRGNLIEIGGGFVGIDEACSGMRSMQAALMIALLMGELFRFSVARRGLMVGAGLIIAFGTNVGRSLYLVSKAATEGVDAIAGVHDNAGLLTMGVCIVGLWILGWLLRRRGAAAQPLVVDHGHARTRALPLFGAVILATVVAAEAATEAWFSLRGGSEIPQRPWILSWPEGRQGFTTREVIGNVKTVLGIDTGTAAGWIAPDGSRWIAHFLRWEPAPLAKAILAKYHSPEVCMPASGAVLRENLGRIDLAPGDGMSALPFHQFVFEEDGAPVHVFYMIIEDRSAARSGVSASMIEERLRLVWAGQRKTGQTAIHVAIRGIESPSAAADALRRELADWITLRITN